MIWQCPAEAVIHLFRAHLVPTFTVRIVFGALSATFSLVSGMEIVLFALQSSLIKCQFEFAPAASSMQILG